MRAAGHSVQSLAEAVDVDPKSVRRWVAEGRLPHSASRAAVAHELGREETFYWPTLLDAASTLGASRSELVQMWPSRDRVPHDVWRSLIDSSRQHLDVLAYSGGFLVESFRLVDLIHERAGDGLRVRIALGDGASANVQDRGRAEGLPSLPARAASTIEYLAEVVGLDQVEVRVHATPLYASLYRFDDELLVNSHTHGLPAKDNPIHHYRAVPGGQMLPYYLDAFQRVWDQSYPPGTS